MSIIDYKNENGKWVIAKKVNGRKFHTRAGLLWENMCSRTRCNGAHQKLNPSYVGAFHTFNGFQDFAEWATQQVGYLDDFEMDKDLIFKGNKVYSKETILFLPLEINRVLPNCRKTRGNLPIGVHFEQYTGYSVRCRDANGGRISEYNFDTPDQAFQRYKVLKEGVLRILADKWKDKIDSRAYSALINYSVDITD